MDVSEHNTNSRGKHHPKTCFSKNCELKMRFKKCDTISSEKKRYPGVTSKKSSELTKDYIADIVDLWTCLEMSLWWTRGGEEGLQGRL